MSERGKCGGCVEDVAIKRKENPMNPNEREAIIDEFDKWVKRQRGWDKCDEMERITLRAFIEWQEKVRGGTIK